MKRLLACCCISCVLHGVISDELKGVNGKCPLETQAFEPLLSSGEMGEMGEMVQAAGGSTSLGVTWRIHNLSLHQGHFLLRVCD